MNIFVKLIDQAVSEKQLSAKIEQAKAVKIEGSPAKEVIEKNRKPSKRRRIVRICSRVKYLW